MKRRFQHSLFLAVLALVACASARAADPDHVAALVKGGATQLALHVLDNEQKSDLPPEEWVLWERHRLAVLRALRKWDELAKRVERLPKNVPAEFRREAIGAAVEARLAANDAEGARRYLRRLLWDERVTGAEAVQARRLVIRSYVQEGRLADAQAALLRYQQEFQAKSEPWQVLHAEILLQADNPRGALNQLSGLQSHEARLLRLAANLRAKLQSPRDVLMAANKMADGLAARPDLRRAAWVVAAEAASAAGDGEAQVLALERALSLPENGAQPLFRTNADELWQAYDQLAEHMGNTAKWLVGNDEDWLHQAESIPCAQNHVARALYAFLTRRAEDAEIRSLSHRRLAAGLMRDGRSQTLESLYTESSRYPVVANVPVEARYALADKAIADYNIRLAAQLVRGLDSPPEGEAPEDWGLRRARILVYAGEYKPAVEQLESILRSQEKLDSDLTARLLQVVFDLQAVDRHDAALRLLEQVYAKVDNDKLRRELLFWMADSQSALKKYKIAAELYLRTATFGGASGEDPWGHTARLLAAEALGRAGLTEDARRVYLKLLEATPDPRRRAQIERQMQQLWLSRKPASTQ
jgi:hypothetical protein